MIEPGEFPFPLTGGPEESPYLTWLRNHSNFMAARGFLDYLRAAGVLMRGMMINFVIFLPYLLAMAVVLAYAHHWMRAHPYWLTLATLGLAVGWVIVFALQAPILRVATHRRSVETGSDSTVRARDRYERTFGALLLAVGVLAALESLPWILESFHDQVQLGTLTWKSGLASAAAGLAALSGSSKLLTVLRGVRKQVAMVLVGLLGLLVPLLVILSVTEYLLYGVPPSFLWMLSPLVVPLAGVVGIAFALLLGLWRRSFTPREVGAVAGLLGLCLVLVAGVVAGGAYAVNKASRDLPELETALQTVGLVAALFERIEENQGMTPAVVALVGTGAQAVVRSEVAFDRLEAESNPEAGQSSRRNAADTTRRSGFSRLLLAQADAEWVAGYLEILQPFASLADEVSELPDDALVPLRDAITRLAHRDLLGRIEQRGGGKDAAAAALRGAILEHHLDASPAGPRRRAPDEILDHARTTLRASDEEGIVALLDEAALMRAVEEKFARVPGTAQTAQLDGRSALAALLTKEELLALVFPSDGAVAGATRAQLQRRQAIATTLPQRPTQLAALATTSARTEAPDSASRRLAFFHRLVQSEAAPAGASAPSRPGATPTREEIGRAAGARLAARALEGLDADYLRWLAFEETREPAPGELDSLVAAHTSDSERARRLEEFLVMGRQPLERLVADSFPPPAGAGFVSYEHRSDSVRREIWRTPPALWPDGHRHRLVVAAKALGDDTEALAALARGTLLARALAAEDPLGEYASIIDGFALFDADLLSVDELSRVATLRYWHPNPVVTDELVTKLMFGVHGGLDQEALAAVKQQVTVLLMVPNVIFVLLLIVVIASICWMTIDVNHTSVHGLYRDRLASAFLVGRDTRGNVGIEDDIDLDEICRYDARSTAPYHLMNVALNLQGSRDIGVRNRQCDFFIFSRRFVGGQRTGYCRSETLEQVFPQIDVGTAMAISAAAASPNMGRSSSPFLVAFMTLLNIRLGFWIPNPGRLGGYAFRDVFAEELADIESRRRQVYAGATTRSLAAHHELGDPTVAHGLVGIGFSGGGIRSAAINLGVAQALHRCGAFDHLDYMSTVSGGGYIGASISTLMRSREKVHSEVAGTVSIERGADEQRVQVAPHPGAGAPRTYRFTGQALLNVRDGEMIAAGTPLLRPRSAGGSSEIAGAVAVEEMRNGEQIVRISGRDGGGHREHRFSRFDSVLVKSGDTVKAGQRLIRRGDTLGTRYGWRVRPRALVREALGRLDETQRWVNLSDGGHIENTAAIELLRRRCKYIIIGDAESDPHLHFTGFARLMRYASIDLGIQVEIDLDALRLRQAAEDRDAGRVSRGHWALGTITYPPREAGGEPEIGHLLYLKSSFTGDEGETIREYRHRHPAFPHESTADQAFDEDQFEAYRALGQHIAEEALGADGVTAPGTRMSFREFEAWFTRLREREFRETGGPSPAG